MLYTIADAMRAGGGYSRRQLLRMRDPDDPNHCLIEGVDWDFVGDKTPRVAIYQSGIDKLKSRLKRTRSDGRKGGRPPRNHIGEK